MMTQILIAVLGMTPQLLTETLYALLIAGESLPDRIRIVTTTFGRRSVAALLGDQGQIAAFAREYQQLAWWQRIAEQITVRVPLDAQGMELEDVDTLARGQAMHALIFQEVAAACDDANACVHVSLAGGRKTMSFIAGQALSIFGRRQDRLSHVLLNPKLETQPKFFFPPHVPVDFELSRPAPQPIVATPETINTADARVQLAEVAFVRLSVHLDAQSITELRRGNLGAMLASVQQQLTPSLVLHSLKIRTGNFMGKPFSLAIAEYAMLLLVAEAHAARSFQRPSIAINTGNRSLSDSLIQHAVYARARVVENTFAQHKLSGDTETFRMRLKQAQAAHAKKPVAKTTLPPPPSATNKRTQTPLSELWTKLRRDLRIQLGSESCARLFHVRRNIAALHADVEVQISDRENNEKGPLQLNQPEAEIKLLREFFPDVLDAQARANTLVKLAS